MDGGYFKLFNDALRVSLGLPVVVLALLAMVVVPLPPFMLDVLFSFNISLSLVVILAVVYILRPLDLAVFPTVLLAATVLVGTKPDAIPIAIARISASVIDGSSRCSTSRRWIRVSALLIVSSGFNRWRRMRWTAPSMCAPSLSRA